MQENSMDQPTSLSQLLRESYLAEARAHHRHGESSCIDSPRRLVYGTLKEKADDSGGIVDPQFPDLSAFLSQEELDKSVDLACKAFSSDPREREERSDAHPPVSHSNVPSNKPTPETEVISERHTVQTPIQDTAIRNVRSAREPAADFKRPQRNAPYGLETQSKKEFLNKAADFIEELSSLFKANSSKRIRPRTCKTHRSRYQNKTQLDGTSYSINTEDRERPILLKQQMEEPVENSGVTEEPYEAEEPQEPEPEPVCEEPALIPPESSEEPVCEPPHFIQRLKSREVPEGSKVQLDCIVRGLPAPEVRWFCEGKELENSPDIQIIANGERHSLIIAEAFEEDTGRYSCFASNFYGTDSTSAEIYIEEPPTPISEVEPTPPIPSLTIAPPSPPSSQSVSDILLTSHQSNPEVQKHTKSPVLIIPTNACVFLTFHVFFFQNLNGSSSYLQSFDVRPIMAAPVFTKNLQDVLAVESQLVVLECRVKGIPSPKVDWYREGTLIEDSPDFRILQKKPRSMAESEEICTLVIAEVFPEDSGTFTCTASNKYGTISSTAALRVKGNFLYMGPISSNVAPVTPMPSVKPTIPITQPGIAPNIPIPPNVGPSAPFHQLIMAPTTQPPNHVANMPPITPSTHISQINMNPTLQMNSVPVSDTSVARTQALMIPDALALYNTAPKINTTSNFHPSMAPQVTYSQAVSYPSLSKLTSPHLVRNQPAPIPSPMSPPPLHDTQPPLPGIIPISTQSFSYTRPKEFIAAQMLSPIRSPSPTESPVPMLHQLAAQIFPKSTRELMSPVNQLSPSPRKFPTRVLECPSSPPYVSSPPLVPPGLVNSMFSFRPQSPPQASSPTSSSSTPSPIQNPVAFLSSVLPSLPTSPLTNAMGLPKSALKKNQRGSRLMSDDDIRESKETLLQDIEKKLRFKDEQLHFGQQVHELQEKKVSEFTSSSSALFVFEYKVSSFEQRLMSEIGFRLERTPVEESDDEVQHNEIPSGKCIAPIFNKKLKHFRAVEGIPVTFTCKVVGIPIPKVYWFKDGKQILKKNEHYKKIREGDGTCSLHIEAVTSDDDGNYTVMAANPQVTCWRKSSETTGRISCSGHLIVQTGPVRNRTMVSGLPHPEIMWLLNGRPIYPDLTHRMLVRENGIHSLVMDPLTQADDGTYTCIASNKAGQKLCRLDCKKELKQAPHFVEKLQNTGIAEGSPVRLECRVVGMPQPLIFWKKDNDTIPHSKDRVSMHQDTTGYVCLLIQPTRKEDAGWYTVSAKNEAGIVSCTARLDIYAQWYQHVHAPMKKTQLSGSRYAALTSQGLDIKSAFPMSDIFSASQPERRAESEEL
uniref:Myopalladin-like n=1 Tax=Sinocyclocheilus rhinocerous TaxID=307959 RepID=A0A673FPZ3_9TELE